MNLKKKIFFSALLLILMSITACNISFADEAALYFEDKLVFSADTAHNVAADSKSVIKGLTTGKMGEFENEKYDVLRLAANSGTVSFDLSVGNGDVVLEFEEIQNKTDNSYGYYINVEGTDVYLRVGRETSIGPAHYFVNVPSELTSGKDKIKVTLRNVSGSSVAINRVWCHTNPDKLRAEDGIDSRMTVMLFCETFGWSSNVALDKVRPEVEAWIEVFGNEEKYKNFKPGFLFEINYFHMPDEEIYERIDELIKVSRELDVPIAIDFNSWWGGTPWRVPDGKGGFFTDLEYQQAIYAPNNVNGYGRYKTTNPGPFNGMPWLSLNNKYANKVRYEKYGKVCRYTSMKIAESRALAGAKEIPEVSVFIENEPLYWRDFLFTQGEPYGVADVSKNVTDALKENYGVDFDPTDGLTEEEQAALFYNINDYAVNILKTAAENAGTDYIIVDGDKLKLPGAQLMDSFYTHQFDTNVEHYVRCKWDTFETAFTKNGHVGLEGYGLTRGVAFRNIGDLTAGRGKFAAVNLETGGDGTYITPLADYYAFGASWSGLFNVRPAAQPLLAEMDSDVDKKIYTEPFEGNELYNYDFEEGLENGKAINVDDLEVETNSFLIETNNIVYGSLNSAYVACPNSSVSTEGSMTFCVDNKGKPFDKGLVAMLYGSCASNWDPNCRVQVYAGSDKNELKLAATFTALDLAGTVVDLSDYIDKTNPKAYFRINLFTSGNRGWCGVYRVRALEKYGEVIGHTNGYNNTYTEKRLNSLLVTYRADVERMLAEQKPYCGTNPDYITAESLYEQGKYKSAKKLLLGTASLKMPAKFMVTGSGTLNGYPVEFETANSDIPVGITLKELGETVKFELRSSKTTNITLKFSGMSGRYTLEQNGNEYTLSRSGSGEVIESEGVVTLNLTSEGHSAKKLPQKLSGFISDLAYVSDKDFAISFHDTDISDTSSGLGFNFAENAVIRRGPADAKCDELTDFPKESIKELTWGERADITLNENGEISNLAIRYGLVKGTVTNFIEAKIPEMTSPYMEITEDDTGKKWLFKLDSRTLFDSSKTSGAASFAEVAPGKPIGFKKGNIVNVCYLPLKAGDEEYYYATKIYEEYTTVVDEDLNDSSYTKSVYSENNVTVEPLDGNNLDCIGLAAMSGKGSAVWKIQSDKPIKEIVVLYGGRAIFGSNVYVKASANGYIYEQIGDLASVFSHNLAQMFSCYTDSPEIVGGKTAYVKMEFDVQPGTTWGFLNAIQIKIKV